MLQVLILRTRLCGTGFITQHDCVVHFCVTKMVKAEMFCTKKSDTSSQEAYWRGKSLNIFAWFIEAVGYRLIHPQNRYIHPQKNPIYPRQSTIYTQKRPVVKKQAIGYTYTPAKETYTPAKEPYLPATEPYIHAKETCSWNQKPWVTPIHPPKRHTQTQKNPMYPQQSTIYTQKRPVLEEGSHRV